MYKKCIAIQDVICLHATVFQLEINCNVVQFKTCSFRKISFVIDINGIT